MESGSRKNLSLFIYVFGSFSLISVLILAIGIGFFIGFKSNDKFVGGVLAPLGPISLDADTAVKGKTISMATGAVSEGVEGLYVLDHASGNLQCWVLNPRTGAVGGIFQRNVLQDLPTDKPGAGDYVMVTGAFIFRAPIANNMSPSASICYVADESTGNVVGYSFNFNRQALTRGTIQSGAMTAVCAGPTRMEGTLRDQ